MAALFGSTRSGGLFHGVFGDFGVESLRKIGRKLHAVELLHEIAAKFVAGFGIFL